MPPVCGGWKRPAGRDFALLAVFAALMVAPLGAQEPSGATITPIQGLGFGQLIGGFTEAVPPTDVLQRAHIVIEGDRKLDLRFVLPTTLQSVTGSTIPLAFGSADGIVSLENRPTVVFNPNAPFTVPFQKKRGLAQVYLGGVATPAPDQAAGTYSATVTILLIDPRA